MKCKMLYTTTSTNDKHRIVNCSTTMTTEDSIELMNCNMLYTEDSTELQNAIYSKIAKLYYLRIALKC